MLYTHTQNYKNIIFFTVTYVHIKMFKFNIRTCFCSISWLNKNPMRFRITLIFVHLSHVQDFCAFDSCSRLNVISFPIPVFWNLKGSAYEHVWHPIFFVMPLGKMYITRCLYPQYSVSDHLVDSVLKY